MEPHCRFFWLREKTESRPRNHTIMSTITISRVSKKIAKITFTLPTNVTHITTTLVSKPIQLSPSTLAIKRKDGSYTICTHLPTGLVAIKGFRVNDGVWSGPEKRYVDALGAFYASYSALFFPWLERVKRFSLSRRYYSTNHSFYHHHLPFHRPPTTGS